MAETYGPLAFDFKEWAKTTRLFRDIVVTEKIDGTNSAIHFDNEGRYGAQSRKRLLDIHNDNFGFMNWVHENSTELFEILGPGTHFGEWWGKGIQRGYGMGHKVFSLFNTKLWGEFQEKEEQGIKYFFGHHQLSVVPTLYSGEFNQNEIADALNVLDVFGSVAAPGFTNPEGVAVYHTSSNTVFKVTLDNNDAGKWEHHL